MTTKQTDTGGRLIHYGITGFALMVFGLVGTWFIENDPALLVVAGAILMHAANRESQP